MPRKKVKPLSAIPFSEWTSEEFLRAGLPSNPEEWTPAHRQEFLRIYRERFEPPFSSWTEAEQARGYRIYLDDYGDAQIQNAPGRSFVLGYRMGKGPVDEDEGQPVKKRAASLLPPKELEKCPDYGEHAPHRDHDFYPWLDIKDPDPENGFKESVGPVSAEYLVTWLRRKGFDSLPKRGEQFLGQFVFDLHEDTEGTPKGAALPAKPEITEPPIYSPAPLPAKRHAESKRLWVFQRPALDRWFPGMNWAEMMSDYHAMQRDAKVGRVGTRYGKSDAL